LQQVFNPDEPNPIVIRPMPLESLLKKRGCNGAKKVKPEKPLESSGSYIR